MASNSPELDISEDQALDFKMLLFVYENRIRNETKNKFWWGQFKLLNPEVLLTEQELVYRFAYVIHPNLSNYGMPTPIVEYFLGRKSLSPKVLNDKNLKAFSKLTIDKVSMSDNSPEMMEAQAAAKKRYTRNMLQRIRDANDDQAIDVLYKELKENPTPAQLNSSSDESPKDDLRKRVLKRNAGFNPVEGMSALIKRPKSTSSRILSHLADPQPSTSGVTRPKMG